MKQVRRVYVAGPYSSDQAQGTRAALAEADELLKHGYAPFVPHLTHFWHMISPKTYSTWLALDLAWLPKCDALLRLPGISPGADREVAKARELGLPVYYSLVELIDEHRLSCWACPKPRKWSDLFCSEVCSTRFITAAGDNSKL